MLRYCRISDGIAYFLMELEADIAADTEVLMELRSRFYRSVRVSLPFPIQNRHCGRLVNRILPSCNESAVLLL